MVSRIVLPVLNIEQDAKPVMKKVLRGAKQFTEQRINSQSNSTSSTSFSFQPPSQNTVIDRCIYLNATLSLTSANDANGLKPDAASSITSLPANTRNATDTSVGFPMRRCVVPVHGPAADQAAAIARVVQPNAIGRTNLTSSTTQIDMVAADGVKLAELITGNNLAPRQFPLANAMQSLDVTINGTHFTVSPTEYIQAVMRYTTPQYRNTIFSGTAHAPDRDVKTPFGFLESPLNLHGEGSYLGELPRGLLLSAAKIKSTTNLLFQNIREPLFISPLLQYFGHGMTNINEINVTINWCSGLFPRMFSYVPCNNVNIPFPQGVNAPDPTDLSVTVVEPKLILRYYTPDDDINIPAQITLPYNQPYRLSKSLGSIAANNGLLSFTGDNIRLNQIPAAVYIWIQRSTAERNMANHSAFTDYHNPIDSLQINFGNQTSILGNLNKAQLVDLAVDNGFDAGTAVLNSGSWNQQNAFCLKLVFGKDIPLPEGQTIGLRGDFNFQVTGQYEQPMSLQTSVFRTRGNTRIALSAGDATDATAATANLNLEQLFIYSGKVDIRPQECTVETGIISVGDINGAEDMDGSYDSMGYEGGSFVGGSHVGGSVVGGSAVGGGFGSIISGLAAALPGAMKAGKDAAQTVDSVKDVLKAYQSRK